MAGAPSPVSRCALTNLELLLCGQNQRFYPPPGSLEQPTLTLDRQPASLVAGRPSLELLVDFSGRRLVSAQSGHQRSILRFALRSTEPSSPFAAFNQAQQFALPSERSGRGGKCGHGAPQAADQRPIARPHDHCNFRDEEGLQCHPLHTGANWFPNQPTIASNPIGLGAAWSYPTRISW